MFSIKGNKPFKSHYDKGDWLQQLEALVNEGYPLKESLHILAQYYKGKSREMILDLNEALLQGEGFAEQLGRYGFSKEVTNYLSIMEKHGDLQKGLQTTAALCFTKHDLIEKGKKLLQYPLIMLSSLILLVTIVLRSIVPQFEDFFFQLDQELPVMTKVLFASLSIIDLPFLVVIAIVVSIVFWKMKSLPSYKRIKIMMKVPILNSYGRRILTYLFVSQLAPMLENGMSLNKALKMMAADSQFPFYQYEAETIRSDIQRGLPFSEVVGERSWYEPQLVTVIALAEAKGKVGEELMRYGMFLFHRLTHQLQQLVQRLQPVLYIVVGGFVLLLFMSLMLPVFQMTDTW